MRTLRPRPAALALGLFAAAVTAAVLLAADPPPPASRPAMWKEVDDAVTKGLPKTAVEKLAPIIESALKDKAYPEAIKAVAKRIALEGNIQGNKPEERITRMTAAIAAAPKEMAAPMHALLGHWYWQYFQQNRWRFVRRTATAAPPGNDFSTWDLPRLFDEIDAQYAKALAGEKELKAIPIATYDDLLEKGTVPDAYRPTLYDFVAHEALAFYSSGEQAAAKAQDAFEIDATGPALAPAAEFLKWQPQTTDDGSRKLKAVKLFQALLAYHAADADKSAFLDADLLRLRFAFNAAFGEEKASRYKAALKAYADANADHPLSASARHLWAGVLNGEGDHLGAEAIAQQGFNAFPNSTGGAECFNLIQQMRAKAVTISTERVWADPYPTVRVRYKNFTKLHFRAVKYDWAERITRERWRPEYLTPNDHAELLKKKPAAEWAADLPATPDYHERSEDVAPPKDLKPGFYFLLASTDPTFPLTNSTIAVTDFWVSTLALVVRPDYGNGRLEGFVLQNNSGEPIANAKITSWTRDNDGKVVAGPAATTDANGLFAIPAPPDAARAGRNLLLLASHEGQELGAMQDYYLYKNNNTPRPQPMSVLFTDRSLYRPGQTVQFKGIALVADTLKDSYNALPGTALTVLFADPNGKEIAKLAVKTNDYGSFSGSFTAPRDRLAGRMTISVQQVAPGMTQVSVEEYKRPKFQVTLDAPADGVKLNGVVAVPGKAVGYTGAAVGGAKIAFRVTREVRWPSWFYGYYYWRMPVNTGAQEIAHGTAVTDADGTFRVSFTAKPDLSVPEKDEPTFQYTVHADVTDTTGETRSAEKSVSVGYTTLQAGLTADAWQTAAAAVKLTITTKTLDGVDQAAKGTLTVVKLVPPEKVQRPDMLERPTPARGGRGIRGGVKLPPAPPKPDPADPATWAAGEAVVTQDFATDVGPAKPVSVKLPAGLYRATVTTQDKFGKPVTAVTQLRVLNPDAAALGLKLANVFAAPKWTLEPGEEFKAVWGTGYDRGRAFVEVEHRGKLLQAAWTDPARTQKVITQGVDEGMRGGFTVRVTYVRENRAYLESHKVDVPWSNKDLTVKWDRFVSKLEPGKKETYTATVTGPKAAKAVAEMVAAVYDASLDAFLPHQWLRKFNVFRQDYSSLSSQFENVGKQLYNLQWNWGPEQKPVDIRYRAFPYQLTQELWGYAYFGKDGKATYFGRERGVMLGDAPAAAAGRGMNRGEGMMEKSAAAKPASLAADAFGLGDDKQALRKNAAGDPGAPADDGPDLSKVSARKNLNETAFFFPHLMTDAAGSVKLEFTMPEALTKWKFLGFAHDASLRSGFLTDDLVTAKDLMVQPNPPRFLREGDVLEFSVKVSNQSATKQTGKVRLTVADARSTKNIDAELGNTAADRAFAIAPGESQSFAWKLTVPDGQGPITYTTVGATDRLSDGEEGVLPVLSRRILVTESLPLPVRGKQTKTFDFAKLRESAKSNTIKSQSLTVQMTSQPAWYAVMALPYLMEFPHECSEQTFNRLYANALARHIAAGDPKIRRVFDQWKNTPALDSPLAKNQDLKAVMLEETPWLRDGDKESEARRNVGVLFDDNRLTEETARLLKKLAEMQRDDGMWPWFPGGPENHYLTLYITTGFGRLRHLGVKIDVAAAVKAVAKLDAWMDQQYRWILAHSPDPEGNHLSTTAAFYLYGRSFFVTDKAVAKEHEAAMEYWKRQAKNHWLKLAHRQSQAHMAVGLKRLGDKETPTAIMKSIKERSVSNEEMGLFWRDQEYGYSWFHAPIETQAMMIEALDEVSNDAAGVEDAKVWLLKQKQTQNWKTTKATADAVYALLLRGDNLLKSDAVVEVTLGADAIKPANVEAGTGFYEQKFVRGEVKPAMGTVTVKKPDAGVSWGSVHWQYLEDITKVTPHEGTPLKLEKTLFKKTFTKKGPVLEAVAGPVAVGDELVCRIVLRTDRDMEYVHLKDHRGSGTEPVNVLSQYKFQDGLYYYESTKDTASHFFIDYLPKGVYVFEYAVRVQHRGQYPTGLADVQCMYAPEFNSHSASVQLEVK